MNTRLDIIDLMASYPTDGGRGTGTQASANNSYRTYAAQMSPSDTHTQTQTTPGPRHHASVERYENPNTAPSVPSSAFDRSWSDATSLGSDVVASWPRTLDGPDPRTLGAQLAGALDVVTSTFGRTSPAGCS